MKSRSLYLYNTESRQCEPLKPPPGREELLIYTCGPTVYNYAHIGNFRTYVFEDLLRRTLRYFGTRVIQVMNLTDVDDKTIRGALEQGVELSQYTHTYKEAFFHDLKTLHIEPVEFYPAATDYIAAMIAMIEQLLAKGIAYRGKSGDIFFAIEKFPNYGRLSHLDLATLKVGASERVATDEYDKESAADFVLWKAYHPKRDGSIYWNSPFGKGRPGWHIECSAMATQLLGSTVDLHVGGVDNIFPHHENEIAQSEGCSGHLFVRHWAHCQHLIVEGKKMSKSLGNFYTLRDLLARGYTGEEVRYLLIATHYRTQLNFTFEGLDAARHALSRLCSLIDRLRALSQTKGQSLTPILTAAKAAFDEALADDLNISVALAALFDFVRKVNTACDEEAVSVEGAREAMAFLRAIDRVLGFLPLEKEVPIPDDIQAALEKRELARKNKDWAVADEQRNYIEQCGYQIEDTAAGPRVKAAAPLSAMTKDRCKEKKRR
ncbi:MAG: cysteine--tRNA ligase [Chlamydiota bacterium]